MRTGSPAAAVAISMVAEGFVKVYTATLGQAIGVGIAAYRSRRFAVHSMLRSA
jgi:hypothetical protein